MTPASPWSPFDSGATLGREGGERGVILLDEEHADGARITLERDGCRPFSITCGVYGCMVHTRHFRNEHDARTAYQAMKTGLEEITNLLPLASDEHPDFKPSEKAIERFIETHP